MNHMRNLLATVSLAGCLALALALPMIVAAAEEEELEAARAGTEAYADVAATEAAGYGLPPEGPLHQCIASTDGTGAMGFHFINGDLVGDIELDPATPEALVYEEGAGGGLTLVALEYVVFAEAWDAENDAPPVLFEQEFMLTEEPNRYELPSFYALHAWVWKENPSGLYAGFNPDVSCPAGDEVPDTALIAPAAPYWIPVLGAVLILGGVLVSRRLPR
ncbi:MAG: hypothetical protein ACT4OQ_01880 [Chloroflexota bacterium]